MAFCRSPAIRCSAVCARDRFHSLPCDVQFDRRIHRRKARKQPQAVLQAPLLQEVVAKQSPKQVSAIFRIDSELVRNRGRPTLIIVIFTTAAAEVPIFLDE